MRYLAGMPKATKSEGSASRKAGKEDPTFYAALGRAIKVARAQLDIERKDLADSANVSYAYLSDIETGRGRPGSRSLLSIAEALGRTPSELMQEAEMYSAQMSGEVPPSRAGSQERRKRQTKPDPIDRFNEEILAVGLPSSTRLTKRDAWRDRLAAKELDARNEVHALVDRLPREDIDVLLAIVRRLSATAE